MWLSIVIDDEITEENTNGAFDEHSKPRQLPNLECNIICGNTLIDEYHGNVLITKSSVLNNDSNYQYNIFNTLGVDKLIEELIGLQDKLFFVKSHDEKEEIKRQIQNIYNQIIVEQIGSDTSLLESYYDDIRNPSKPFILWQLYFPKVFRDNGGFDIVIGNPPYIGEEGHKEIFQAVAATEFGSKYYIGKMDFWYFFVSKGIELLAPKGALSFIAPNNWMTTAGGKKMRSHIASTMRLKKFVTFNNVMIFESASQQTMVFLMEKEKMNESYSLEYKEIGNQQLDSQNLHKFLTGNEIGNNYLSTYDPSLYLEGQNVQFLNTKINDVISKIAGGNRTYLDKNEILNGIHPHHASVTKKMLPLLPEESNVGDGIFIISLDEISKLDIPKNERVLLKPFYDTNNVGRYYFDDDYKYMIIYTTSDFKDITLMDDYPVIKKHLDYYVNVITSDNRPYGLHRARKQEFFDEPAIASLRKCQKPTFALLEKQAYLTAEWYLIKSNRINMKYLTCLFNSELVRFWLLKMGKMQGSIFQVDKEPLLGIPIAVPSDDTISAISEIYDQIMERRKDDRNSDITELENNVDKLIFCEYGLDDHDVSIIRNELNAWDNR